MYSVRVVSLSPRDPFTLKICDTVLLLKALIPLLEFARDYSEFGLI